LGELIRTRSLSSNAVNGGDNVFIGLFVCVCSEPVYQTVRALRVGFNIVYIQSVYEQCEYIYPVDYVETHLYNDPLLGSLLAAAW